MANGMTIEDMAAFCKRKGFVYPSGEIYGGLAGFFDFGHLGSELKSNIKREWWRYHVMARDDVVGIDGSIITNPKVWVASGHAENFDDLMLTCIKCREKVRADTFIEEKVGIAADGMKAEEISRIVQEKGLVCQKCKSRFEEVAEFNLMFTTQVGPKDDSSSKAYLRPETAQLIFSNFRLVSENARQKLPFGIAQIGKAFRNEISPRDFLFRCREFEQMEIEYFIDPKEVCNCPFFDSVRDYELLVLSADMQNQKDANPRLMKVGDAVAGGIIKTPWHGYWLAVEHRWFCSLGARPDKFRIRQHVSDEKSHYALDTWDLEYEFPFGWKELQGMANRTDFDLQQHMKHSGKDLALFDEETKSKIVPHVVAEPSQGVERAFLVFMFDAYTTRKDEKGKDVTVLKLHPRLAPVKAAVFPLVKNQAQIVSIARKVYDELKMGISCQYDESASVGRRYARADEIGVPYCITVDFDSQDDGSVTIRERDSAKQVRVKIDDIRQIVSSLVDGTQEFLSAGKPV